MQRPKLPAVLAQLVQRVPPLMDDLGWTPDRCIAATRVAVDILRRLGFTVKPQPTKLTAFTKKLWHRVDSGTFDRPFLPGEYSIGIGYGYTRPDETGYDGHLVALVKGDRPKHALIVDLALGQASRPERGLVLPPAIFSATNKIFINDCVLVYEPHDNTTFTEAPDWTRTDRTDPVVEELLRIIS